MPVVLYFYIPFVVMKKLLHVILLFCGCIPCFGQPSDTYLLDRLAAGDMPGGSFTIVKEGKLPFLKSLGKSNLATNQDVTEETIFMLASVSKTVIATAIMQLWERGLIDLDADINHYLPFSVRTPAHPSDSITARMLLTHTAAIEDNWNTLASLYVYGDSPVPLDSFLRNYLVPGGTYYSQAGNFYTYTPGAGWNYSNVGSTLAAYLVETITGDKFHHYCDTAIFTKLCMDNTSFLLSGITDTTLIARPYTWSSGYVDNGLYGYPDYPDGQLRTNLISLTRFMTMYLQHGSYNGARILDSATVAYMLQAQTPVESFQGIIFYSAISSNGDTLWGHNGGDAGVNTAMYFNPDKEIGVIVLTNGNGSSVSSADLIADTLYKAALLMPVSANDTFPSCKITGVPGFGEQVTTSVYPNPTNGQFLIEISRSGSAAICGIDGKRIILVKLEAGNNEINLPDTIEDGIYLLQIRDKEGRLIAVRRLMLQR